MNYIKLSEDRLFTGITETILVPSGFPLIIETILNKEGIQLITKRGKIHERNYFIFERALTLSSFLSRKLSKNLKNKFSQYSVTSNDIQEEYSSETLELLDIKTTTTVPQYSVTSNDIHTEEENNFNDVLIYITRDSLGDALLLSKSNEIQWYIDLFIKYDLMKVVKDEVSFLDWNKQAFEGGYISKAPRAFDLNVQFNRRLVEYRFKSQKLIDALKAKRIEAIKRNFENPIYLKLINEIPSRYEFPSIESVEALSEQMVASGATNNEGKLYVLDYQESDFKTVKKRIKTKKASYTMSVRVKVNQNVVSIQEGIAIYKRFLNEGLYFKDTGKHTRYYTSLSLMPSWIRKLIKIDGQEIIENDFSALHNRLVNSYCGSICPELTGDSHTKLMNALGLQSRQEAKMIGLSYWNSRIMFGKTVASKANAEAFGKMDEFLQTKYPKIWYALYDIKSQSHTDMSKLLMRMERELMENVINEFVGDAPYIYTYDCIYCTKSIKTEMESLIQ